MGRATPRPSTIVAWLLATAAGLVVALDGQAKRLWSRQMPTPPTVVRAVGGAGNLPARLVVGCEDGTMATLNGQGEITALGKVTGRPTDLRLLQTPQGPLAVVTTDTGQVAGYRP